LLSISSVPLSNQLLAALPMIDRLHMLEASTPVDLEFSEVLAEHGEKIRYVYFPVGSFISLVEASDSKTRIEVGMVGDEGMLGSSLVLGIDVSPFHALVQGAGPALRMKAATFRKELARSAGLERSLKRYLYVVMGQLAQTAACSRFHLLEARLARWLLMTEDRAHGKQFHVTHVFLAFMLGVRRVGITKAATSLQNQGLISYSRGNVTIVNRAGLEKISCSCYQIDKKAYTTIMK